MFRHQRSISTKWSNTEGNLRKAASGVERKEGVLWKLTKLPYGIPEAGRQWARVFEEWLMEKVNLTRVNGVPQMFVNRDGKGEIHLILAKVTDNLLIAGETKHIEVQWANSGKIRNQQSDIGRADKIQRG